jgi:sulfatase modifying factor 1
MGVRVAGYLVLIGACGGPNRGDVRSPPNDDPGPTETAPPGETDVVDTDVVDTDVVDDGPCPPGMALVDDRVCVDRWEAHLEVWDGVAWLPRSPYSEVGDATVRAASPTAGAVPQGYVSGAEAADACEAAGKRLCTSEEWLAACQGPDDWTWPYGATYQSGACNDVYAGGHPVVDYFGTSDGVWDGAHMNDPGINQQPNSLARGGEFALCESAWGVFDLHGNLHEWVDDPAGTFRGGFYADGDINGPGCTYRTTAHDFGYHDYSTGFRCCVDPR